MSQAAHSLSRRVLFSLPALFAPVAVPAMSPPLAGRRLTDLHRLWKVRLRELCTELCAVERAEAHAEAASVARTRTARRSEGDRATIFAHLGATTGQEQWGIRDLPKLRNAAQTSDALQGMFPEYRSVAIRCRRLVTILQPVQRRARRAERRLAMLQDNARDLGCEVASLERQIVDYPATNSAELRIKAEVALELAKGADGSAEGTMLHALARDLLAA